MHLVFTKNLTPGMSSSKDIFDINGCIKLLSQGTLLTQSQIDQLEKWGLSAIYIDDAREIKNNFAQEYAKTLDKVMHAFTYIHKFKEVPIHEMQELIDQKIPLLIDTLGIVEHLHNIRSHNESTFIHSLNVAILSGILGKWCNYQGTKLKNLILAGLLHDIGKFLIPRSILNKPARLSTDEFAAIKSHPEFAYQLIKHTPLPQNVKQGILQHHESLDGTGYPYGLYDREICDEAKIIAITDIYDAITSDRIYRSKMTPFEALDILVSYLFNKLDPTMTLIFIRNIQTCFIGSNVLLSNGLEAKIISFSATDFCFTKPIVFVKPNRLWDLQKENLRITEIIS